MEVILDSVVEEIVKKYGFIIFIAGLVLSIIFAEGGLAGYIKTKLDTRRVLVENIDLEKKNGLLKGELERIEKDDRYLEELVRSKYGFLREGEKLYRVEK
ncbi:MAG: septum formation initiator family protein [Syntrophorhabdaceae bacterium]|nr:septum formation initiator family protein [Syntrophorhabdaceae bacterium]